MLSILVTVTSVASLMILILCSTVMGYLIEEVSKEFFDTTDNESEISQITGNSRDDNSRLSFITTANTPVPEPVCDAAIGAMLISQCPPGHISYLRERCEDPTLFEASLGVNFPVSTSSGLHFRSLQCLQCWDINEPVQMWSVNLTQSMMSNIGKQTKNVKHIVQFILENPGLARWIPPDGQAWPACPDLQADGKICEVCGDPSEEDASCSLTSISTTFTGDSHKCYVCHYSNTLQTEKENFNCDPPKAELMTMSIGVTVEWINPFIPSNMQPLKLEFIGKSMFSWTTMECDSFGICKDIACKKGVFKIKGTCNERFSLNKVQTQICVQDEFSLAAPCAHTNAGLVFQPIEDFYAESTKSDFVFEPKPFTSFRRQSPVALHLEENTTLAVKETVLKDFATDLDITIEASFNKSVKFPIAPHLYATDFNTLVTLENNTMMLETSYKAIPGYYNSAKAMYYYYNSLSLLLAKAGVTGKLQVCTKTAVDWSALSWICKPLFICSEWKEKWHMSTASQTAFKSSASPAVYLVLYCTAQIWSHFISL